MRVVAWLLVIGVAAWGVHALSSPNEEAPIFDPAGGADAVDPRLREEDPAPGRPTPTHGSLVIRVQTAAGDVPPRAQVGFEALQRETWTEPDGRGRRVFTNVPVGPIVVLARAPGFLAARQERHLPPGVTEEALLILRPDPSAGVR